MAVLRAGPKSDKYGAPFTSPCLSYTDFVTQTISPHGSVYSPLISTSNSLVASTARASAISFPRIYNMRLYLDDRGVLLFLGAYEQLLYDGLKEFLVLVVSMCSWVLQVFVDALHCRCRVGGNH